MIRIDHLNCPYHIHKHIGMLGDRLSFTINFSNIFTFLEKFQGIDTWAWASHQKVYLLPSCTQSRTVLSHVIRQPVVDQLLKVSRINTSTCGRTGINISRQLQMAAFTNYLMYLYINNKHEIPSVIFFSVLWFYALANLLIKVRNCALIHLLNTFFLHSSFVRYWSTDGFIYMYIRGVIKKFVDCLYKINT